MMRLRLSEQAEEDISDHFAWFGNYDPAIAENFLSAARKSIELLLQHPNLGRRRKFEKVQLRSWRIRGFPKIFVFYSHNQNTLTVHRVLHGSRDVEAEVKRGGAADESEI